MDAALFWVGEVLDGVPAFDRTDSVFQVELVNAVGKFFLELREIFDLLFVEKCAVSAPSGPFSDYGRAGVVENVDDVPEIEVGVNVDVSDVFLEENVEVGS